MTFSDVLGLSPWRSHRECANYRCNCRQESGMVRVRLADLNGPKWTSSGQDGPKWTILVHFGLENAKKPVRNKVIFDQNGRLDHFGPFWSSTLSDSTAATPRGKEKGRKTTGKPEPPSFRQKKHKANILDGDR